MQKGGKEYSFLYRRIYKNRIKIHRIALPKEAVHASLAGVFLFIGISVLGVGITVMARNADGHAVAAKAALSNVSITEQAKPAIPTLDINASDLLNSGGPEIIDEDAADDPAIAEALKQAVAGIVDSNVPNVWPHESKINNEFGFRRNPFGGRAYEFHPGMDIGGDRGDEVVAPGRGTVIKAGWTGGYGNMIEIDHGNGVTTRYGHLSKIEVQVGDMVNRGDLIGLIGSTGRSTGPHLHYELRLGDRPINPRLLLPQEQQFVEEPTVK